MLPSFSTRAVEGVDRFLSSYVGVGGRDGVILCYPTACRDAVALLAAGVTARELPMVPLHFEQRDDESFERLLAPAMSELRGRPDVDRLVVIVCEYGTLSFTKTLRARMRAEGNRLAVVRVTNCIPELFEMAFQVTPEEQRQINAGVLHALLGARRIRIRNDRGTDLVVDLDSSRYGWVSNYGMPGPSEISNLPAGEVNTFPASISGRLVADGGMNSNLDLKFDTRLAHRPITVDVQDGNVRDFHCPDPRMADFLEFIFNKRYARVVGELGIGTNVGIDRFIPLSSHINERHPGVHLGFGEHNQPGIVEYKAEVHLDMVTSDILIEVDDRTVVDTRRLVPSTMPHPLGTRGEDTEALPRPM